MKSIYISSIVMIIVVVIIGYIVKAQEQAVNGEYCIIQGDNVNVRMIPYIRAKVVTQLKEYEFVYCIGKTEEKSRIGDYEDYWYKVRNCDNKEGWVFGKYVYYIDSTTEMGKYYKKMIDVEIVERLFCNPKEITQIYKLSYENGHYIMDFKSEEKLEYAKYGVMGSGGKSFYRIIDGIFTKTIDKGNGNILFYKQYILFYDSKGIDIYNTKKFTEPVGMPHYNIPCKYYESTGFYLNDDVIEHIPECNTEDWRVGIKCISYSDMEFNTETMEVVVNVRIDKDKLLKQEKYKFKEGKFCKD